MSYNSKRMAENIEKSKLNGDIDGMLIKWKIYLNGGIIR